ncbi:MAG: ProQ/FinO family protein [Planctomycetes bacterium]|nr:ProQ/FinO family protein [Planctomycetota bacterium]
MITENTQIDTTNTAEIRGEQTIALQSWLTREYPKTFNLDAPVPLKIGIHLDLAAQHPDLDPATLKRALKRYCERRRYQLALAREGACRVDLAGNPAGEVTAEQQKVARRKVAPRNPVKPARRPIRAHPHPHLHRPLHRPSRRRGRLQGGQYCG